MQSQTRTIEGAADFELGRPRSRPLSFTISTPDEGKPKGLVFAIPGFGADTAAGYAESLRRHICDTHGFAAVSVDYHCVQARPENGGVVGISPREHFMLIGMAAHHGLKVSNYADINELTAKLAKLGAPIEAYAEITPGGGEYQNFGVVQAMDHLAVLADIVARGPEFDHAHVIALGSSHGGYIAHMMAKIAPRSLSAVIDNSSYTQPPMNFMAQGIGEYHTRMGGVKLLCRVKNGWNFEERAAANFYDRNADLIRDVAYPPHIAVMREAAGEAGAGYLMVNAVNDGISRPALKQRQAAAFRAAGLSASLDIIDKPQIDGRVFKELIHGLNASLKGLFDRMLPQAAPRSGPLDCEAAAVVDYPCIDKGYRFHHGPNGVRGETYDLFATGEEGKDLAAA